ncbi:secretion protein HlyD [Hyphomicrobium methylovorum]|uniref:HlyD family secretion protein n=1 Tax=Hyphomicrobium methylovorum TaxID=84 RepID=UPI0015E6E694|nr:efflux RND transporter periplasmic adaptor subunit [Hyphomicrobium methylovorum]MBA2127310.1 secretion protein HlyD [Hyphomicrobium methylovorum]
MSTNGNNQRPKRRLLSKIFVVVAAAGAGGLGTIELAKTDLFTSKADASDGLKIENASARIDWVAAAPGRIEPKSGLVRVGAALLGRISEVTVKLNDKVEEGELLIRLDDDEARARLQAAETEVASRKRERDAQPLDRARDELRKAEDDVFSAERALTNARFALEFELQAQRQGTGSADRVADARQDVERAKEKLQNERSSYATAQAKSDIPAPNRLESALQAARSDVQVAEALLEKTRIRAPVAGTILQLPAKAGEMVAPSPDQILAVLGDMSVVRLKAEVDEIDVSKIKLGGKVVVKSNAYPGKEFEGVVAELAPSLTSPQFALRGARRPMDVEVLAVTVDLSGNPPLLPGMRADAFFK